MKYLLLVFLLFGCSSDQVCSTLDSALGSASKAIAEKFDCNIELIYQDLISARKKVGICDNDLPENKSVLGNPIICTVVPSLVKVLGDQSAKRWECQNLGSGVSDMVSDALNCN